MLENDFSKMQNFWLGVLAFFIPLAGIVLAIIWWQDEHHTAKIVLICALIPISLVVLLCGLGLLFALIAMANLA